MARQGRGGGGGKDQASIAECNKRVHCKINTVLLFSHGSKSTRLKRCSQSRVQNNSYF